MGALELHAERSTGGSWQYLDSFSLGKDYGLFHVLGAPGFSKYAALPNGTRPKRIRTATGLPADPSGRLREIADEREGDDEGSWRHVTGEVLVGHTWHQQIKASFLAGPVGFTSYRQGTRSSRWIEDTPERRTYLSRIGARIVPQDELGAFLDADAGSFIANDPLEHKARVVTRIEWAASLADYLGFQAALDWVTSLGREPVRIALWIEI